MASLGSSNIIHVGVVEYPPIRNDIASEGLRNSPRFRTLMLHDDDLQLSLLHSASDGFDATLQQSRTSRADNNCHAAHRRAPFRRVTMRYRSILDSGLDSIDRK